MVRKRLADFAISARPMLQSVAKMQAKRMKMMTSKVTKIAE